MFLRWWQDDEYQMSLRADREKEERARREAEEARLRDEEEQALRAAEEESRKQAEEVRQQAEEVRQQAEEVRQQVEEVRQALSCDKVRQLRSWDQVRQPALAWREARMGRDDVAKSLTATLKEEISHSWSRGLDVAQSTAVSASRPVFPCAGIRGSLAGQKQCHPTGA